MSLKQARLMFGSGVSSASSQSAGMPRAAKQHTAARGFMAVNRTAASCAVPAVAWDLTAAVSALDLDSFMMIDASDATISAAVAAASAAAATAAAAVAAALSFAAWSAAVLPAPASTTAFAAVLSASVAAAAASPAADTATSAAADSAAAAPVIPWPCSAGQPKPQMMINNLTVYVQTNVTIKLEAKI